MFVATLGEPSGAARRRVRRVAEELALARGRLFFGALLARVRLADRRRRGRRESCGLLARVRLAEYALPKVEEDVVRELEPRPDIAEPEHEDDAVVTVTPEDAANSSILKMSGAPASKRRRVFDDRLNVVPLGPLPGERPLGPSAHEVWFGRPES